MINSKDKKVAIALSTYNGEKYIEELMQSLLDQTYDNITILVRDDGSSDGTVRLLKELQANNSSEKRIVFIEDNKGNLRFGASFTEILRRADEFGKFDYFAFCDQDDIWLPQKVEYAVAMLTAQEEKTGENTPAMYTANIYPADEELNYKDPCFSGNMSQKAEFTNQVFEGIFYGFTMFMNRALKELAFGGDFSPFYQDKWIVMITLANEYPLIYDERPVALFRRHNDAASSANRAFFSKMNWRIKNILGGVFCENTTDLIRHLFKDFPGIKNPEYQKFLNIFGSDRKNYFQKLFWPKRLRRTVSGEFMLRVMFLLGKF